MSLFEHLTDAQLQALDVLVNTVDWDHMPCLETDPKLYEQIDLIWKEINEEWERRDPSERVANNNEIQDQDCPEDV
jgi:hypothetical protein